MADDLAAKLAEIRGRHLASYVSPWAMAQSGADVPPLLDAVEAALEVHALTEHVRLTCRAHARDGWDSLCPRCDEYDGCTACSHVPVRPEQCETRQAIAKALLGEAVAGG